MQKLRRSYSWEETKIQPTGPRMGSKSEDHMIVTAIEANNVLHTDRHQATTKLKNRLTNDGN